MTVPIAVLVALFALVVALAFYRRLVARDEDDFLHVNHPSDAVIRHQADTDRTLRKLDRWGTALTVAAGIYAVVLGCVFLYHEMLQRGSFHAPL